MKITACSGLIALAFLIASLGMVAEPAAAEPRQSWTGFYAGVHGGFHGGGDASRYSATDTGAAGLGAVQATAGTLVDPVKPESGLTGGALLGYNYQSGAIVVGVEADISYLGAEKADAHAYPGGVLVPMDSAIERSLDYIGTVRARIGYLPSERLLFFATGGLAYGNSKVSLAWSCASCGPPADISASQSADFGYVVGAGLEAAVGGNWSIRAEYLYYDLGTTKTTLTYAYGSETSTLTAKTDHDGGIGRIGLVLKF